MLRHKLLMAISIFRLPISCKPISPILSFFYSSQQFPLFFSSTLPTSPLSLSLPINQTLDETEFIIKPSKPRNPGGNQMKEWKKLCSRELGISTSMIPEPTKVVLKGLRKRGYDVYLVGGCIRDLILKRIPKDFDILTTAELREIIRTFPYSEIVGRRFPICHVHIGDSTVEVSSFKPSPLKYNGNLRLAFHKHIGSDEKDYIRWRNCMQRDFTINGLLI